MADRRVQAAGRFADLARADARSGGVGEERARAGLSGSGVLGSGDEALQLGFVEWLGAEEALVEVAAPFLEQMQLGDILDALDDHLEVELLGEADHRLDDDAVAAS